MPLQKNSFSPFCKLSLWKGKMAMAFVAVLAASTEGANFLKKKNEAVPITNTSPSQRSAAGIRFAHRQVTVEVTDAPASAVVAGGAALALESTAKRAAEEVPLA